MQRITFPLSSHLQVALNFLNDSCKTTLHLRLQPRQIAAGALYTALKISKAQVGTGPRTGQDQGLPTCPSAQPHFHCG